MTGRELYHRWCGSSTTDAARYYDLMNPANRRDWDRLAAELEQEKQAAIAAVVARREGPAR